MNKIKSILLACLLLVGFNAVKADISVKPGMYYFDFSKIEGGVVYGADVFRNINNKSYLVFDVTDKYFASTTLSSLDASQITVRVADYDTTTLNNSITNISFKKLNNI